MPNQPAGNRHAPQGPYIFLDIDGTLADFWSHAERENKLTPDGKLKYGELDYNWWVTMPAYAGAKEFYDEACALGAAQFLSGPARSTACFRGKADWAQEFAPEQGSHILDDLILCCSEKKFLLAAPGRILVDDDADNIREWRNAGGIGILHKGDYAETLKQLKAAVEWVNGGMKRMPVKKWDKKPCFPGHH